jgi:energy-coupling factor transporter ATP-binding protein EcfA2
MNMLQAENLSFAYGSRQILKDVSFSVRQGETVVLSGLSGSGKTTLCQILCGLIPGVIHGRLTGRVLLAGECLDAFPPADRATRIGLVFQDADSQIIGTRVEDELAFGLENICLPPAEIRRRVDGALTRFALQDLRGQNPSRLSGGQKRLLTLAGIMILDPEVLVLDEPAAGLDADGRTLVRQAIDGLRAEGRTIIWVEHDLRTVTWADRWLILAGGSVAALDTPSNLMADLAGLRALGLWFDEDAR